ncbi:MAG: hypothetical protein V3T83_09365 [Acidobacteriota bacterium]
MRRTGFSMNQVLFPTRFLRASFLTLLVALAGTGEALSQDEKKNEFAVFLGATTLFADEGDETSFTLGADYSRDLGRFFNVGGLVDADFAREREILLAPFVDLKATDQASIRVGAGISFVEDSSDQLFVARFGFSYKFEFSKISLIPAIFVDLNEKSEVQLIYGLSFGFPF